MGRILIMAVLATVFMAAPAAAKEGFYLGAGFIHNEMLNADLDYLDSAVGLDFKAGYNFGAFAVEAGLLGSSHTDRRPGFGDADFGGLSIDFRIPFNPSDPTNRIYVLAGLSGYTLTEHDPVAGEVKLSGGGENLGVGVEHFFNESLAFNLAAVCRSIRYDQKKAQGQTVTLSPRINGDTLSVEAGVNYYF